MTLVSTVGGASGPLFGTLFLRMGAALGDTAEVAAASSPRRCGPASTGVVARGKAEPGDKTMFDALAPAVDALETRCAAGRTGRRAASWPLAAAENGRDATIPMLARKGRASYLGERSVGHQDPGATSIALLMARRRQARAMTARRRMQTSSASSSSRTAGRWPGRRSALARRCCTARPVRIAVAAGLDEATLGTDAVRDQGGHRGGGRPDGVVVLMDLGSAVLSAELALDLLDDPGRDRVMLSAAPLVEGLVVAAVAAAGGAGRNEVAAEAQQRMMGKAAHLGRAGRRRAAPTAQRRASRPTWWPSSPSPTSTVCTPGRPPAWSARCAASTPRSGCAT